MSRKDYSPFTRSLELAGQMSPGTRVKLLKTHVRTPFVIPKGATGTVLEVRLEPPRNVSIKFDKPVSSVKASIFSWDGEDFEYLADEVAIMSDASQRFRLMELNPPKVRYRRNAPSDVVETTELVSIAKDMVKEHRFDKALEILAEGGLRVGKNDGAIANVFFQAVQDELASGKRAVAKKLFTKARKMWREQELPTSLHKLVAFTKRNVEIDMEIAIGDGIEVALQIDGVYRIEQRQREWWVVEDDDAAETLAIERVREDLEHDPEIFIPDFLLRFLDEEMLRAEVRKMALDHDYWNEANERDVLRAADQYGLEYEEDDDGEVVGGDRRVDELRDEVAEAQADERANAPLEYLAEIISDAEVPRWLIDNIDIDVDAAAEAAVREDGAAHFLAHYDGNLWTTVSGFVYWRVN